MEESSGTKPVVLRVFLELLLVYAVLEDFKRAFFCVYVLLQAGGVVLNDDAGTSTIPSCEHDPVPLAGCRMVLTSCVCGLACSCVRDNNRGELQLRARARAE